MIEIISIFNFIIFIICISYLLRACFHDFKTREIPNNLSYELLLFGVIFILGNEAHLIYNIAISLFFIIFGWFLYLSNLFGGGDCRLIMVLPFLFIFESYGDTLLFVMKFLIVFLIIAVSYPFVWKLFSKKSIAFAPAIVLIYLILSFI